MARTFTKDTYSNKNPSVQKQWKRQVNSRFRAAPIESDLLPVLREAGDVWTSPKEWKRYDDRSSEWKRQKAVQAARAARVVSRVEACTV